LYDDLFLQCRFYTSANVNTTKIGGGRWVFAGSAISGGSATGMQRRPYPIFYPPSSILHPRFFNRLRVKTKTGD
jgi:hypothetical protein